MQQQGKTAHGSMSEKKLSKRLGGKLTPGSGAIGSAKGDIIFKEVLMEAKATIKDSIAIKLEWLAKISREATDASKAPALAVTYVDKNGDPRPFGSWVMIREKDWNEICKKTSSEET